MLIYNFNIIPFTWQPLWFMPYHQKGFTTELMFYWNPATVVPLSQVEQKTGRIQESISVEPSELPKSKAFQIPTTNLPEGKRIDLSAGGAMDQRLAFGLYECLCDIVDRYQNKEQLIRDLYFLAQGYSLPHHSETLAYLQKFHFFQPGTQTLRPNLAPVILSSYRDLGQGEVMFVPPNKKDTRNETIRLESDKYLDGKWKSFLKPKFGLAKEIDL